MRLRASTSAVRKLHQTCSEPTRGSNKILLPTSSNIKHVWRAQIEKPAVPLNFQKRYPRHPIRYSTTIRPTWRVTGYQGAQGIDHRTHCHYIAAQIQVLWIP
jgi:hypothetical protein